MEDSVTEQDSAANQLAAELADLGFDPKDARKRADVIVKDMLRHQVDIIEKERKGEA